MEGATHDHSTEKSDVPDARAWDGYNPRSELIDVARVCGVTSAVVHPTLKGLIPGQAGLVRTDGDLLSDVLIQAPVGLCINLGRAGQGHKGPKSRIALMQALRKRFDEIKSGPKKKRKKSKKDAEAVLRSVKDGTLMALIRAERADDIERALDFIAKTEINAALVGCAEGHLVARLIADAEIGVLLGPLDVQPSSFEHPHARYENAAVLHAAGVRLGFRTGSAHGVRALPTLAGIAVAHGLPWEAAIHSLSRGTLEILGVDELGRMAPGAEATFFTVDGDPLQPRHPVRQVWIRGQACSMETRQTRLAERFKVLR
jgi:hypothetical protein